MIASSITELNSYVKLLLEKDEVLALKKSKKGYL